MGQTHNVHGPGLVRQVEQVNILNAQLAQLEEQASIGHLPVLRTEVRESIWKPGMEPLMELASCSFVRAPRAVQETWAVAQAV